MSDCGCEVGEAKTADDRRVLRIAFLLNVIMFFAGTIAGLIAQSSSLLADALDMLADASAYGIALMAIQRGALFKARASLLTGALLLLLGAGVLADVARRGLAGSSPQSLVMIATATVSLVVNATVLRMLGRFRQGEVHLRATWIFTRADVIANAAVILSGVLVLTTHFAWLDLVVGAGIGLYVIKEAVEILREAREANASAEAS